MAFPKTIAEIIEAIDNQTLVDGNHIEQKVFHDHINFDSITRSMVAMANSGGGVIVIGIGDLPNGAYILHGIPDGTERQINVGLREFIRNRTKNLDNWRHEIGKYLDMDIAAIFVEPSKGGFCFIHSENDVANRTYYYRSGDKNISVRSQFRSVYKYMTLDAAIACMEGKSWRFYEPTKWPDKFERRFYCADYSLIPQQQNSEQKVYATCVTRTQNSEAAWKVYAGNEGMKSHCVQLEMDWAEMILLLFSSGYRIYERKVDYVDEYQIMHLHESANKHHAGYFSGFCFDLFLNLLALKRDAYTYENELRYFAVPQVPEERTIKGKASSIDLSFDWSKVIKRIRVDKKCSISELVALRHSCWSCGINPVIKGANIPGKLHPNAAAMKQVEVVLFNIDDMPGRKSITIEP